MENSISRIGRAYADYGAIVFGPWEGSPGDESDPPIPDEWVWMGTFSGQNEISDFEFYSLCLQFAEKALDALDVFEMKKQDLINDDWIERIKKTIPKLKERSKQGK